MGLCRLVTMVGASRQIYKGIVELLRARWTAAAQQRGSKAGLPEDLLCSLRRHILMALHGRAGGEDVSRYCSVHAHHWGETDRKLLFTVVSEACQLYHHAHNCTSSRVAK